MSPPLVVAFALAGRVSIDMSSGLWAKTRTERTFSSKTSGRHADEISEMMLSAFDKETYRRLYSDFAEQNPLWNEIPLPPVKRTSGTPQSTYIQEPPYFEGFGRDGR